MALTLKWDYTKDDVDEAREREQAIASSTANSNSDDACPKLILTISTGDNNETSKTMNWSIEYKTGSKILTSTGDEPYIFYTLSYTDPDPSSRKTDEAVVSKAYYFRGDEELDTNHVLQQGNLTFTKTDTARTVSFKLEGTWNNVKYTRSNTGTYASLHNKKNTVRIADNRTLVGTKNATAPNTGDGGGGNGSSSGETGENARFPAEWSTAVVFDIDGYAATTAPPAPEIEIEGNSDGSEPTLIIKVDKSKVFDSLFQVNLVFEVIEDDVTRVSAADNIIIRRDEDPNLTPYTEARLNVKLGHHYNARCRTIKTVGSNHYESEWSAWSNTVQTAPTPPEAITKIQAASSNGKDVDSIYLEWTASNTANTYDIQYSLNKEFNDNSNDDAPIINNIDGTKYTIRGFGENDKSGRWFVRVRAVGEGDIASDWSAPESVLLGEPPGAPTTWSSASVITVGEPINFYWVHSSMDGSAETYANLSVYVNDELYPTPIVYKIAHFIEGMEVEEGRYYTDGTDKYLCSQNGSPTSIYDSSYFTKVTGGYDENETSYYTLDTSGVLFKEGAKVKWKVQTAGITNDVGPWSIEREIDVYAKPTIDFTVTDFRGERFDTLSALPIYVKALTWPETQAPIGYYLSITAKGSYTTRDAIGNPKVVHDSDLVYYKYFDITTPLDTSLSAGDVTLENNIEYEISCIASMNSGLTAEASATFTVGWSVEQHIPTASVYINRTAYATAIKPYCEEVRTVWYMVNKEDDGRYTVGHAVREEVSNMQPLVKSVEALGKNLLDIVTAVEERNCEASAMNGVLSIKRTENGVAYARLMPMYLNGGTKYVLSYTASTPSTTVYWFDMDGDTALSNMKTFTPSDSGYYCVAFGHNGAVDSTITINKAQVEAGSKATPYEDYQGVNVVLEKTTTGVDIYVSGDKYYCPLKETKLVEDVVLSVYRREYDGSFTEIAKNVPNQNVYIPDPHPSLDYARYRIVATSKSTGYVSYYDLPNQRIGCKSVIIQWDEEWNYYDADKGRTAEPTWTGSLLDLPYNISVSDKREIEVEMVKYIGRKHPVSYYGTHLGETASWSCEIPKTDKETLYALRRLATWAGDVYVREPSGVGYWAHIVVNFSQKHLELTIPVSFEITRVEGGM